MLFTAACFFTTGCGGNAGVSDNTGDNITIEGTVSGAAAPSSGPGRAIAGNSDMVFLFVDGNAETSSQITNGKYFFYGNYKAKKLMLRFGLTNNEVYIGIIDLAATGTITLPAFDEYSVFSKKILDAQVAEGKTTYDKYLISNDRFDLLTLINRVKTRINEKFISDPSTYGATKEQLLKKINDRSIDDSAFSSAKIEIFDPAPKTFSITPTNFILGRGESSRFTVSMTGFLNTSVYFKVQGIHGGTTADGLIGDDGTYIAPNVVNVQRSLVIEAQSVEDPTATSTASVTLTPVTVVLNNGISPVALTTRSSNYQFFVSVTGHSNKNIKAWYVNGVAGGDFINGFISSVGLYTAPVSVPTGKVKVTAVSSADETKYGECEVVITQ